MAEYITKEQALQIANYVDLFPIGEINECLRKEIENIPAADVAPVKHGKWIMKNFHKGVCNQCHRLDDIDPLATHCRYCGAKMDLEE